MWSHVKVAHQPTVSSLLLSVDIQSNRTNVLVLVFFSDGYIYISPISSSKQVMTSPLIRTHFNIQCMRFWYFLSSPKAYGSLISIQAITGKSKVLLWESSAELTTWQYVQIPLTYRTDLRVSSFSTIDVFEIPLHHILTGILLYIGNDRRQNHLKLCKASR